MHSRRPELCKNPHGGGCTLTLLKVGGVCLHVQIYLGQSDDALSLV